AQFGQLVQRLGLLLADQLQQGAVVVGQHFGQRAHGGEPDFRLAGRRLAFAACDGPRAVADGFLRGDANDDLLHAFASSNTRSTSPKKSLSNWSALVNS